MRICLIGKNLTNLVLAKNLSNKNLNIDIICDGKKEENFLQRTLAISKNNFNFLLKINKKINISYWPIKKIKIYGENNNSKELFEFKNKNSEIFYLVKYNDIFNSFYNVCKKNKYINFKIFTKKKYFIDKKKYKLIINSDSKNNFYNKSLNKGIEKNYNSIAYTGILNHERKENNVAVQIFTKFGPLAFLPLSNTKTSIVFSISKKFEINEFEISNLIKKYNLIYKIKKINEFEKFNLKYLMLRNYIFKNTLYFGDLLHRIHPLAGQGFNMTIRDIKILSLLIDEKIELGLDLDNSIFYDFQKRTKHYNYIFGSGVDFIHDFFQIDNKTNNLLSGFIFKILRRNKLLNKYATLFADKGINI